MSALETTVASVSARRLDIPMVQSFGIAGGSQDVARNVLVEVVLRSGTRGWGEAAPLPAFNGETQADALSAIDRIAPALVGEDAAAWKTIAAERLATLPSASAACAIETAIVDAYARASGVSLLAYFGGKERSLRTDFTITTGTEDDARRDALAHRSFETLKIKVGGSNVDLDVSRVLAVHDAAPSARLFLDANGGLDVEGAVRLASELRARGVVPALFEQPIAAGDFEALAEVRRRTGLPVALDESVTRAEDVVRAHRAEAADAVNVKLMKSGIARALAIVDATRAAGWLPMIGGMVEARLAMGTSACLAAGLGGFAYIDLDTPLYLADDPFDGGIRYDGDRIELDGVDLGHGCIPRGDSFVARTGV